MKLPIPERSVLVVCGPGGVGKTSLSCAMALAAARSGKRVALITIDPARRLQAALGNGTELGNDPRLVQDFPKSGGALYAAMLDAPALWIHSVKRLGGDKTSQILGNRFFLNLSQKFSGSIEFMAAELMYQLSIDPRFDKLVIDTAPSEGGIDFLSAPERLSALLDSKLYSAMKGIATKTAGIRSIFANRIVQPLVDRLKGLAGGPTIEDMFEFISLFGGMRDVVVGHSVAASRMLSSNATVVIYVAVPDSRALAGVRVLEREKVKCSGVIINRVRSLCSASSEDELIANIKRLIEGSSSPEAQSVLQIALDEIYSILAERELRRSIESAFLGAVFAVPNIEVGLEGSAIIESLSNHVPIL